MFSGGVESLPDAEHDEVLVRFDVADVLAVRDVEREPQRTTGSSPGPLSVMMWCRRSPISLNGAAASPSLASTAASPFFLNMRGTPRSLVLRGGRK
jgi:hypothetical protein